MGIRYSQGLLYISVAGIQITLLQCYIPHVDILIFFGKYFLPYLFMYKYILLKPLYVWPNELTWLTFYISSAGALIMGLLIYPDILSNTRLSKLILFCTCN